MRKLRNYYLSLMAIVCLGFLASCSKDDEANPKATITFEPSAPNDAVSLAPGDPINLKVVVTSTDNLKSFKRTVSIPGFGSDDSTITSFAKAGYEFNVNEIVPPLNAGTVITYTFTATTSKGEVTTRSYTITVLADMVTYTAKILGNQNATVGSFFSTADGSVLNSTDAKANSAKVDLVYYYSVGGNTDLATIAAPSDPTAQAVYGATTTANIPSWATKNATSFKMSTATAFSNATDGTDVETAYMNAAGTASTKVKALAANNVFVFMTAGGKHGIATVKSVTLPTTANGNKSEITLDIKMQR